MPAWSSSAANGVIWMRVYTSTRADYARFGLRRMWSLYGNIWRRFQLICAGDPSGGPIARLSQSERFLWLSAPRSTILQPSPVHTGVLEETEGLLDRLARQVLYVS